MSASVILHAVEWPAPPRVRAAFTTRHGGVSAGPWQGLNLAAHVGDDPRCVASNRALLYRHLDLPREPTWLEQVHGNDIAELDHDRAAPRADAAITRNPGRVAAVLVADCVPVLLCDRHARAVAAVHAGWRGLATGVIARAVQAFGYAAQDVLAWIGPAIGTAAYVVGAELRADFVAADATAAAAFFDIDGAWHMDLALLARRQLQAAGVYAITHAAACVHAAPDQFYSYRRDGVTGRMAALIWLASR